jgi:hypothetical protein
VYRNHMLFLTFKRLMANVVVGECLLQVDLRPVLWLKRWASLGSSPLTLGVPTMQLFTQDVLITPVCILRCVNFHINNTPYRTIVRPIHP